MKKQKCTTCHFMSGLHNKLHNCIKFPKFHY